MSNLGNLLIVDDEEALRLTLARILKNAGFETMEVSDGYQALEMLGKIEFDLILLDIHLPKMDGIDTLRSIRNRNNRIPVIMLTGYGSLQTAVDALRLGATDYLLKPIDPEVLIANARIILQEKYIERRKDQIREQIMALQAELSELEKNEPVKMPVSELMPVPQTRFLKLGRLILDLHARRATFGERVLIVPPATYDYLVVLAKTAPKVVDYRTLVREAQEYQVSSIEARELAKWHVHVLRNALEEDPQNPQYLLNVRGKGYRLLVD